VITCLQEYIHTATRYKEAEVGEVKSPNTNDVAGGLS